MSADAATDEEDRAGLWASPYDQLTHTPTHF